MGRSKAFFRSTSAWHVMDLRQPYSFCGELMYSYTRKRSRGLISPDLFSSLSLKISGALAYTTSAKITVGTPIEIDLHMAESADRDPISGFIEKFNDRICFYIWVPDRIVNHIHMSLMSSKPEVLRIIGTDLFYRKGEISGVDLLREYDEDEF